MTQHALCRPIYSRILNDPRAHFLSLMVLFILQQALKETYQSYTKHSRFLFVAVSKLAAARYQPHLHDFLLRLNFNEFYPRKKVKNANNGSES